MGHIGDDWRILIAEDEPTVRLKLDQYFEQMGWEVDVVNDGAQAMDYLRQSPYDVVLTDVKMPGMDGTALLNAMREEKIDIPLVAMTAKEDIDLKNALLHNPIAGLVLFKRGEMEDLPGRVERFCLSQPRYRRASQEAPRSVLVVDDEESFCNLLKDRLGERHNVITSRTSLGAHEAICRNDIGVAILDKNILRDNGPAENGIDLARRINSNYPYARIILTSGSMTTEDLASAKGVISGFCAKPFSNEDIKSAIDKAFAENTAQRDAAIAQGTPHIWAVCGPRAVGKSTVVETLVRNYPFCAPVWRYTTRKPRPGEKDGVDHVFVDEQFLDKHANDIAYRFKHNEYHVGVPKRLVEKHLSEGKDALIVISNPESYEALKTIFPEIRTIVLLAKPEFLVDRAERRGGDELTLKEAREQYQTYEPLSRISLDVVVVRNHQMPLPKNVGKERYREYEVERCVGQAQYLASIIEQARRGA